MEERKRILAMAFDHLKSLGMVSKIKDVALAMPGKRPETVSRAMSGNPDYATDQFMIEFDRAFSGIFNLSWLLRGEGEMLVQRTPSAAMPQSDVVAQLIRMCNDLHADVRELKQELAATKAEVEKLKRAHYGYASVAADGMSGIEFEKVK